MRQLAHEAYPRWDHANPGSNCPDSLEVLFQYSHLTENKDPWGQPYVMLCGAEAPPEARGGIGVVSSGADRQLGTEDDVRSWRH